MSASPFLKEDPPTPGRSGGRFSRENGSMTQARVLIVHPEPSILALLGSMLQSLGHQIDEAANDRGAVRRLERGGIDLVIAGVNPTDPEAMELVSYTRRKHAQTPLVLLFPGPNPERAREAMRLGATAVLKFPMPATELRAVVTQACEQNLYTGHRANSKTNGTHSPVHRRDEDELKGSSSGKASQPTPDRSAMAPPRLDLGSQNSSSAIQLIGEDSTFRQATGLASTVASSRTPILIVGEPGTGKSLIARMIHQQSGRGDRPFVEVSCGGIDELGLERELFGQKFEDEPASERPGRLVRADGGTVLLDDISALSLALQGRLLKVLRDGVIDPLGSSAAIPIDVRFILSTRENLPALVEQGKVRRDLYERISDICLKIPPLAQRGEDIMSLAESFLEKSAQEFGKSVSGFTPDAVELLNRHSWPGNVRELESVIQRGVILSQGAKINSASLAVGITTSRTSRPAAGYAPKAYTPPSIGLRPLKEALEEPEKQIIIQALRALNWNRQDTARVLDINRTTLYKKMKKYGLLIEEPALLN